MKRIEVFLEGVCSHVDVSGSANNLPLSNLSGLVVQSKKLPETESNPASDTEERRFPEPNGVPSSCKRCEKRLRLRLLKLMGNESRRSQFGVLAILSRYYKQNIQNRNKIYIIMLHFVDLFVLTSPNK